MWPLVTARPRQPDVHSKLGLGLRAERVPLRTPFLAALVLTGTARWRCLCMLAAGPDFRSGR